jgi:hypothetical protein
MGCTSLRRHVCSGRQAKGCQPSNRTAGSKVKPQITFLILHHHSYWMRGGNHSMPVPAARQFDNARPLLNTEQPLVMPQQRFPRLLQAASRWSQRSAGGGSPVEGLLTCGPFGAPPYTQVFLMRLEEPNFWHSCWIWTASSLVGANTRTIGPSPDSARIATFLSLISAATSVVLCRCSSDKTTATRTKLRGPCTLKHGDNPA